MNNSSAQSPESTLRQTINLAVRHYAGNKGQYVGWKTEAPDAGNQGTNPFRGNSCPFDLLLEVDTRLLMLEVKVLVAPHKFQYMDDPNQLAHLRQLWRDNVTIHYAFNMDAPCPDFSEDRKNYPTGEEILKAIAAITPEAMAAYSSGDGILNPTQHLKRLLDEADSTLPEILNRWRFSHNQLHSSAFLLIAYNLEKGTVAEIPFEDFEQLVSLFQTGRLRHPSIQLKVSSEVVDQVRALRKRWKEMEAEKAAEHDRSSNAPSIF